MELLNKEIMHNLGKLSNSLQINYRLFAESRKILYTFSAFFFVRMNFPGSMN
jgi:hypothetical protein